MLDRIEMIVDKQDLLNYTNKTVLVVGLGGVGGYVVESLVRSGLNNIVIVDHDTISTSNLNRQLIALNSTQDKLKTETLKKRILDINAKCEVVEYNLFYNEDTTDNIFSNNIDYIVDACDTVASKKLLIKESIKRNIPLITCLGTGNKFDPSKLEITTLDKTINDPLAKIMRKWAKEEGIKNKITVLSSTELPVKIASRTPGSAIFVPASAGLLIGSHIFKYFTQKKEI